MQDLCATAQMIWKSYIRAKNFSDLKDILPLICDDIVVIGTENHKLFHNKEDFLNALMLEKRDYQAENFDILNFTSSESIINDKAHLVYGEVHFRTYGKSNNCILDINFRYSMLFRLENDIWKIAHMHQSLPKSIQMYGKYYPKAEIINHEHFMQHANTINKALREALREQNAITSIEIFLEQLGSNIHGERVYIFEEREIGFLDNTYEWCAPGITPQKDNLQKIPREDLRVWYDFFERDESIIIQDLEAIRDENPVLYQYLKPQDIHSLVVCPISMDDRIIGFYGIDNPPKDFDNISHLLWTTENFIVSMLQKREIMQELEQMSYYDQLTGLHSRHAMRKLMHSKEDFRNVGIIYCDVMGLKQINDTLGHSAGDSLLIRASECLKSNFRATDLYRIGGDEFVVICRNIAKDMFFQKIDNLRIEMKQRNANMALGCIWNDKIENMDQAILEADKRMYQEKECYYRRTEHIE